MTQSQTNHLRIKGLSLPGMGLDLLPNDFTIFARVLLNLLSQIPVGLREVLIFKGRSTTRQKIVQRCLGGPVTVRVAFSHGLVKGYRFEPMSSEKYFLLGSDY